MYRAGELGEVTFNGHPNDDAIVELVNLTDARFRVEAPADVVVEGRLETGGAFHAHTLLAKCPSKYESADGATGEDLAAGGAALD